MNTRPSIVSHTNQLNANNECTGPKPVVDLLAVDWPDTNQRRALQLKTKLNGDQRESYNLYVKW